MDIITCPNCKYMTMRVWQTFDIDWNHLELSKHARIDAACNRCGYNRRMYIKKVE